jgi:type IV secretory pathway TrbF-like protein
MAIVVADLNAKTPANAKRQFVELYGAPLLLNRYLTIALVLTVLFAASLVVLNFRTQARYASVKPLVIRINDVGRAEAVDYDATTYRPQAPELRYFLSRFVVTHFSRLRATVQRDYPDSLFFLAPALADVTIATNDHTREIELLLTNPSADDVDVTVKNVTLTELTAPPYRAAIDFEKSYYSQGTRQEHKHETYVAQVQFTLRDAVPNAFIRVNPLGLQITNFRVDQAFVQ